MDNLTPEQIRAKRAKLNREMEKLDQIEQSQALADAQARGEDLTKLS